MKHLIAAACLVIGAPVASLAPLPASAQTASAQTVSKADMGLSVGAAIPEISGTTQTGAPATFDQLKGEKGLVLAFVRSADWCPFCKAQLKDLQTVAADLNAQG